MNYTVYWKAEQRLADSEVNAVLRYLALEYDGSVFKLVCYAPGCRVALSPVSDDECELFEFVVENGLMRSGSCRIGRCLEVDAELRRLLTFASGLLHGKMIVLCKDSDVEGMPRRLPIVSWKGDEFFADERLHEFRRTDNPHERADFGSSDGFEMRALAGLV